MLSCINQHHRKASVCIIIYILCIINALCIVKCYNEVMCVRDAYRAMRGLYNHLPVPRHHILGRYGPPVSFEGPGSG